MWVRVDHALEQGRGGADGDRWIVDSSLGTTYTLEIKRWMRLRGPSSGCLLPKRTETRVACTCVQL